MLIHAVRESHPNIDGDEAVKNRLMLLTAPFILRRKKADVLRELPDKQETVVYVEMTDKQRKLYDAQEQASDRAHRIGQKNKVLVTKLVCRNTVEERILSLQERKRALSELVTDNESVRSATPDRNTMLELLQNGLPDS